VSPDLLIKAGKYTKVSFIVGDQEDKGTLFDLFTTKLTSTKDITTYLPTVFFNNSSPAQIDMLASSYQTITQDGSPLCTSILNNYCDD
jgi:hypothetical protein